MVCSVLIDTNFVQDFAFFQKYLLLFPSARLTLNYHSSAISFRKLQIVFKINCKSVEILVKYLYKMARYTRHSIEWVTILLMAIILSSNGQEIEADVDKLVSEIFNMNLSTAVDIARLGDIENVSTSTTIQKKFKFSAKFNCNKCFENILAMRSWRMCSILFMRKWFGDNKRRRHSRCKNWCR